MGSEIEIFIVANGAAAPDLSRLLSSIEHQRDEAWDVVVRVVTNECTDTTIECLQTFPWARRIDFGANAGYGGAVNRACSAGDGSSEWILACNCDLDFPAGSFEAMQAVIGAAAGDVGCVAPMLLDPPDQGGGIQPSVGDFPTLPGLLLGRLKPRRTRKYRMTPTVACNVPWATGACLALRRSAFTAAGGFDEGMFLDYEDTDLCKRLADRGWRTRFEPSWRVMHRSPNAQRAADPVRQVHTRRSLVRYLARHRPGWEVVVFGLLLRSTLALHRSSHPFAPSWRAALDTQRQLRRRPAS